MTSLISAVVVCSSGARRLDRDLLGEALNAERELERSASGRSRAPASVVCVAKPLSVDGDLPLADAQRRKEEAPLVVGDALDHGAAGGVRRGDGGARAARRRNCP